jgi:soluble lytic murein transglycosylase
MPGHSILPSLTRPLLLGGAALLVALQPALPARAQATSADNNILEAREALRKRDKSRLAAARATAQASQHALLPWVDYWELQARLNEAKTEEVEAFYSRWAGSYVEDRLRNDWLLELGRRRDFQALARDYPRFRMNDDREVLCWWLLTEHLAGKDVRDAGRSAWFNQREPDDGCNMLATALVDGKRLGPDDVWRKARLAVEANRPAAAKAAVGLLGNGLERSAAEALENPARFLRQESGAANPQRQELRLLALMRLAAQDSEQAAALAERHGRSWLSPARSAWGWAYIGRQAAFKLAPEAAAHYHRAFALLPKDEAPGWSEDTQLWGARSALRVSKPAERWPLVLRAIAALSPALQADPAWVYWKARALQGSARSGAEGDEQRAEARRLLESIAGPMHFYAQLAAEDLKQPLALPPAPAPISAAERDTVRASPGLQRALKLVELGLRDEARREWNFTLRGMNDRELLAAARWACEASDWQLCINTSDRTKAEIDVLTRYPQPFAQEIHAAAGAAGLEPALVFGLIRQETRFMAQLQSSAGARGLMQLMPNTARWVAKKVGMENFNPQRVEQINDPATNLKLGTSYLRMVLDDLSGSQAMAAAAYNAGPGRPRRWREGPVLEAAAWAENVPFNETRDYVKKVLSNAAIYAALLNPQQPPVIKARLGAPIGPREGSTPVNGELP